MVVYGRVNTYNFGNTTITLVFGQTGLSKHVEMADRNSDMADRLHSCTPDKEILDLTLG